MIGYGEEAIIGQELKIEIYEQLNLKVEDVPGCSTILNVLFSWSSN